MHFLQSICQNSAFFQQWVAGMLSFFQLLSWNFLSRRDAHLAMERARFALGERPLYPLLRLLMPFARVAAFSTATGFAVKG